MDKINMEKVVFINNKGIYIKKEEDMEKRYITIDSGMVNYAYRERAVVEVGLVGLEFRLTFDSIDAAELAVTRFKDALGGMVLLHPIKIEKKVL